MPDVQFVTRYRVLLCPEGRRCKCLKVKRLYKFKKKIIMAYRRRRFYTGAPVHVYQRTIDGFNIFYDLEDYLVFYTIFATSSRKYNVTVLEQSIMIDHLHSLIDAASLDELSRFVCYYTSVYVKAYNRSVGREGALFEKAFGSAPKQTVKKIKSCIAYIANNPVEKLLCKSVEDYRWNYLAFAKSSYPYSRPLDISMASASLRRAVKEVKSACRLNRYLNYTQLRRMFRNLSEEESMQLTDIIITCYCPFDFNYLASFFEDFDSMLIAVNANTGSEYDMSEKFYQHSDREYQEIIVYLKEKKKMKRIKDVIVLPVEKKMELYKELRFYTNADPQQIKKFLHLKVDVRW